MTRLLCSLFFAASLFVIPVSADAKAPTCVDVETATAKILQANLKGVGPKLAATIVAHRKVNRTAATKAGKKKWNFKNWKTLLKVQGLGRGVCKDNIAKVCFSGKIQKACPAVPPIVRKKGKTK